MLVHLTWYIIVEETEDIWVCQGARDAQVPLLCGETAVLESLSSLHARAPIKSSWPRLQDLINDALSQTMHNGLHTSLIPKSPLCFIIV